jgi:endonuclease/exonuclease/phosphatase family metal-dependent hydrolase
MNFSKQLIIPGIERFDVPLPEKEGIRAITYNVLCQYFDRKGEADPHNWVNFREKVVQDLFERVNGDIYLLQELGLDQALQIAEFMKKMGFETRFRAPHTGKDVREITVKDEWTGFIMGIAFRQELFELVEEGRFWLSENPDVQPPDNRDRDTPKSFDCTHNYRLVMWITLTYKPTGEKVLVATSHYPIWGKVARLESAKLTVQRLFSIAAIQNIKKILFGGDLNLFPNVDGIPAYEILTSQMTDCFDTEEGNYVHAATFPGFPNDKFKTPIIRKVRPDGSSYYLLAANYLDRIVHTGFKRAIRSFSLAGEFNPKTLELYPLTSSIQDPDGRFFASDHCLLGVDLDC